MPLSIDHTAVPAVSIGVFLRALRRIGPLELRQAAFFAERLPDERLREDFHTLLLLLFAALCRGYPRAGREEFAASLTTGCNDGEPACIPAREGIDAASPLLEAAGHPGRLAGAVGQWFAALSEGEALRRMRPLLGIHPLPEGAAAQPLVVYDRERRTFGFQAYYSSEMRCAASIPALIETPAPPFDLQRAIDAIGAALRVSFANRIAHLRQVAAVVLALAERFVIVSGGPGTGKSTLVQCIVRAIAAYDDIPVDAIVLCAPTGRAKARLLEAVTGNLDAGDPFSALQAKTIHSLLGLGFRAGNELRLPYRLVVVDEVSMVDLRLFADLIGALAPGCRLVLVGDMDQLPPIDAGAVMGDMTAALSEGSGKASLSKERCAVVEAVAEAVGFVGGMDELPALRSDAASGMVDHAVFLTRNFRSDKEITAWWEARGEAGTKSLGREGASSAIELAGASFFTDATNNEAALLRRYELWMDDWWRNVHQPWSLELRASLLHESFVNNPEIARKLRAMIERRRILCCVNEGTFGRRRANEICSRMLWSRKGNAGRPPPGHDGQPVIVNRNQTGAVELYNGDLGVIIEKERALCGCFPVRGGVLITPVERITDIDPAFAVSVHKSQGSEFDEVMLVVPDVSAMPVTRPLVYTGITRARKRVRIIDPGNRLADVGALPVDERPGILRGILSDPPAASARTNHRRTAV